MKVLIIEDEHTAARRLGKMLEQAMRDCEIVAILDSIETSREWLQSNPMPDVAFLDIQLADGPSFEIFKFFTFECPVIFVTAYDDFAVEAFRVNAIDYLLKPVKMGELEEALTRARNIQMTSSGHLIKKLRQGGFIEEHHRVLVKFGQTIQLVDLDKAAYFYTQDKVTFVITGEGKRYPLDHSLDELDKTLGASKFFRINRQYIVNIAAIDKMYAYSKSRVKLLLNPPASHDTIVSAERSPKFKKWLTGSLS